MRRGILLAIAVVAALLPITPANAASGVVPLIELHTANDVGWYYAAGEGQARSAISQYEMTRSRTLPGLHTTPFAGSVAVYRLRVLTRADYLLTTSPTERAELLNSGNYIYDGLIGYLSATKQPGTVLLDRLSNGKYWRVASDADRRDLTDDGYTVDGPLGYAPE